MSRRILLGCYLSIIFYFASCDTGPKKVKIDDYNLRSYRPKKTTADSLPNKKQKTRRPVRIRSMRELKDRKKELN